MSEESEALVHQAARAAAKEVFAMLGVDVDDPQEVELFRRDLRFAGDLRRSTVKALGAFIVAVIGAGTAAIWTVVVHKFS